MFEFIISEGTPDPDVKACSECFWLRGAVSIWCTNSRAKAKNGTGIPPGTCDEWAPMRVLSDLPWYRRWFDTSMRVKSDKVILEQVK